MIKKTKKTNLYIAISIVVSFFVAAGMSSNTVTASSEGQMIGCPYAMDSVGICPMTFDEHLAQWLLLFSGITPDSHLFPVVAIGFILFVDFLLFLSDTYFKNIYRIASSRGDPFTKNYIAVLRALKRGLIHPKVYA